MKAKPANVFCHIEQRGDEEGFKPHGRDRHRATSRPGTTERVQDYARRVLMGLEVFSPRDRGHDAD